MTGLSPTLINLKEKRRGYDRNGEGVLLEHSNAIAVPSNSRKAEDGGEQSRGEWGEARSWLRRGAAPPGDRLSLTHTFIH